MNQPVPIAQPTFPTALTIAGLGTVALPAIIARAGDAADRRYVEFFTARSLATPAEVRSGIRGLSLHPLGRNRQNAGATRVMCWFKA